MEVWQNENIDLLAVLAGTSRYYSQTDMSRSDSPFLSMALVPVQRFDEVIG